MDAELFDEMFDELELSEGKIFFLSQVLQFFTSVFTGAVLGNARPWALFREESPL